MKYFTKEAMAYGEYDLKHLTDHTEGSRGFKSEVLGLSKEIDMAGYGPKALRLKENVVDIPIMKRYVDHADKHEKRLVKNIAKGMPYYKWGNERHQRGAKKIFEDSTSNVLRRHTKANDGHQFVISVAHKADDIKAGKIPKQRAIRIVSPQPQGFNIHDKPGSLRFTDDFERLLATGKKQFAVKKTVRFVAKLR
jgi:hypothetical protein